MVFAGVAGTALRSLLCVLPGTVLGFFIDGAIRRALGADFPILAAFLGLACAGLVLLLTYVPLCLRFCPELLERLKARLSRKKTA